MGVAGEHRSPSLAFARLLSPHLAFSRLLSPSLAPSLTHLQREEILLSALTASPGGRPLPILLTLSSSTAAPGATAAPAAPAAPAMAGAGGVAPLNMAPLNMAPSVPSLSLRSVALAPEAQTPRGQEILRSLTGQQGVLPATPRTIADRVARARRAGLQTASKGAMAITSRLSGSPQKVGA